VTDRRTDREKHGDRERGRQTYREMVTETVTDRRTDRGKHGNRERGRQTDRHKEREIGLMI